MSTGSTIAILKTDGTVEQISADYDGDIASNGAILLIHYRDPQKVKELISLGNVRALEKNIHLDPNVEHKLKDPQEYVTTFYGRDDGESGEEAKKYKSFDDYIENVNYQGYDYFFDEKKKKWFFIDFNAHPLTDSGNIIGKVKPESLATRVKMESDMMRSDLEEDYIQYKKELKVEKEYTKLNKDLAIQEESPKRKMKL